MKDYDATEVAFKNGQKKGDAEGYQRGFGDGLAAAGIAPIQWREEADVPFDPKENEDYLVVFREFPTRPFLWRDCIMAIVGRENFTVWLWCPVQIPIPDFCEIGGKCDEPN